METNIRSTCQAFNNVKGEEPGTSWWKKIRNTFISSTQATLTVPRTPTLNLVFYYLKTIGCISAGKLPCVHISIGRKNSPRP